MLSKLRSGFPRGVDVVQRVEKCGLGSLCDRLEVTVFQGRDSTLVDRGQQRLLAITHLIDQALVAEPPADSMDLNAVVHAVRPRDLDDIFHMGRRSRVAQRSENDGGQLFVLHDSFSSSHYRFLSHAGAYDWRPFRVVLAVSTPRRRPPRTPLAPWIAALAPSRIPEVIGLPI